MSKVKKPFNKKWWVLIFAILIIGGIAGCVDESADTNKEVQTPATETDSKDDTANKETPKKETPKKEQKKTSKPAAKKGVLTKEKFEQIKDGMTYEEVVKIVGAEGKVISETGDKGSQYHTVMYEFDTDGFMSNASMMFQGGKLINKAQFGLGEKSDVEISLEEFNKLQNGMTLEEVVAIVGGEGEILSESGTKGTNLHTVMYSYQGKGSIGANVSLLFQGNKLQNKSQFGLE
ncbi:DUF3862 domain-containing protein [Neobacillus sp. YIM B06451]|uniref:DUF3862 domain-containing protein n=1 Tax=Neobacillus sp. YIM B06451 TaxID=3070994 RepID=UPI002931E0FF|nr:DUF3862 domain-containing protein [Neobacillus sp. YIM B06451]